MERASVGTPPRSMPARCWRASARMFPDEPQWLLALRLVDVDDEDIRPIVEAFVEALMAACPGISDVDIVLLGNGAGGYDRIQHVHGCELYSFRREPTTA